MAVAVIRHLRSLGGGRHEQGGILIADAAIYDRLTGLALGPFFAGVAADVVAHAAPGERVLEIGCGPGHLSTRMATRGDLDVIGLDLDPAMIERARVNADRSLRGTARRPSFLVGDVTSLGFPDASFDLVVSTLSMHHWADPDAGLTEIGRVLRPTGRALVWDLRPGIVPFHAQVPDPVGRAETSSMRVVDASTWRWPLGLGLTRRIELAPAK